MMENLAEIVVERLGKELTKDNYLKVSQTAEMYNKESFIEKRALFVYKHMADNDVEWEKMGKLSNVMTAFGKIATKQKRELVEAIKNFNFKTLNFKRIVDEM